MTASPIDLYRRQIAGVGKILLKAILCATRSDSLPADYFTGPCALSYPALRDAR
jgi:hypothetical protein